ncbi:hypothetical protein OH76DRAFT_485445 [Lentinus brumalis]|uniref:Uncharacterized protein n=1 Tax=Lentinus brumalis TaxID=2498619 RepID=A0A371DC92_9APHY|nr:hypothetical protein OH76DRAFT_485445 [Polyporus brumalis]
MRCSTDVCARLLHRQIDMNSHDHWNWRHTGMREREGSITDVLVEDIHLHVMNAGYPRYEVSTKAKSGRTLREEELTAWRCCGRCYSMVPVDWTHAQDHIPIVSSTYRGIHVVTAAPRPRHISC